MIQFAQPVSPHDHFRGSADAPVTLVAYSSYLCLHCRRIHALLEELRAVHGERLLLVHRHFARNSDIPLAEDAAEAVEAAAAQGRFWEMHDVLLAGGIITRRHDLEAYARQVGLDLARFREETAAHRHRERVRADLRSGIASGVRGTPTLFINGHMHADSWDLAGLRGAVAAALEERLPRVLPAP